MRFLMEEDGVAVVDDDDGGVDDDDDGVTMIWAVSRWPSSSTSTASKSAPPPAEAIPPTTQGCPRLDDDDDDDDDDVDVDVGCIAMDDDVISPTAPTTMFAAMMLGDGVILLSALRPLWCVLCVDVRRGRDCIHFFLHSSSMRRVHTLHSASWLVMCF